MSLLTKRHQESEQKENRPPSKKRPILLWGGLFCITILLNGMARLVPGFAEWYAVHIYPLWVGSLGRLCSPLPFSLSEMMLLAGVLLAALWIVAAVRNLVRGLRRGILQKPCRFWCKILVTGGKILVVIFFLYTINCGINYHRLTFSQREGFVMRESTVDELAKLCLELTAEINEAALYILVDENGGFVAESDVEERAREAMQAAAVSYPELSGYYPKAKEVKNSWILSYQQLQGVYSPFTIESNYNRDMPDYNKPHTICHELSHLKGFMREDEANFIAYLACRASEWVDFQYSGSMMAYVYSTNALYREDRELYREIRSQLCEQANRDLKLHSAFWDAYDGKVAEVSDKVNDTYLKVNAQEYGTKSYGRMVDLLLALKRTERMEQ